MTELDRVCSILRKVYDSSTNSVNEAEKELKLISRSENFLYDLINVIFNENYETNVKISSSIALKNYIEKNWTKLDIPAQNLTEAVKKNFKHCIYKLFRSTCSPVQTQLIQVILFIAKNDFPTDWSNLMPQIAETLSTTPIENCIPTLKLTASLFKRYKTESESNSLWSEIKYVLDIIAEPLTNLMLKILSQLHSNDLTLLSDSFKCLKYITRIYHCLIAQEFPEYFEDHKVDWFSCFISILQIPTSKMSQADDDLVKMIQNTKARIIQVITLLKRKYSSDLQEFDNIFLETIWKLSIADNFNKYNEILMSECIKYMLIAFSMTPVENILSQRESIINLCSNVIVPSILIQTHDEELFEDDPLQYSVAEIDGDSSTRRQSAIEFVGVLSSLYEDILVPIFLEFVQQLATKQQGQGSDTWKYKDCIIRIIMGISSNFGLVKFGNVRVSRYIDNNKIFQELVAPDLLNATTAPILLATCIKYLITFRTLLDVNTINMAFPYLISLLKHPSPVIQIMTCTFLQNSFLPPSHYQCSLRFSTIVDNLQNIFSLLVWLAQPNFPNSCTYAIKTITIVMLNTQVYIKGYLDSLVHAYSQIIFHLHQSTVSPTFIHNYFDSFCLLVRFNHSFAPESHPSKFSPVIAYASVFIQQDVHSCFEYFIQFLATIFFDYFNIKDTICSVFYCDILKSEYWDGEADRVYSLSLLLLSFCHSASEFIISNNHYFEFVNIFSKLSLNTKFDSILFNIPIAMALYLPWRKENPFPVAIFRSIFFRLTKLKRSKFIRGFCNFIYIFVTTIHPQEFYRIIESIQPGIIDMIIDNILIKELSSASDPQMQRTISLSLIQILFSIPQLSSNNPDKWTSQVASFLSNKLLTQPHVNVELLTFYSSLGNNDADLLPSNDLPLNISSNALRFAFRNRDLHPTLTDIKFHAEDTLMKMRSTLPPKTMEMIVHKIPSQSNIIN